MKQKENRLFFSATDQSSSSVIVTPKTRSLTSSTVGFEPTHNENEARQCFLHVQPGRGLGFVLSANNDYDHTITSVEKGSIADVAGLKVNDAVLNVNGIDVRHVKYEEVCLDFDRFFLRFFCIVQFQGRRYVDQCDAKRKYCRNACCRCAFS